MLAVTIGLPRGIVALAVAHELVRSWSFLAA
jgi:hypothetical protein